MCLGSGEDGGGLKSCGKKFLAMSIYLRIFAFYYETDLDSDSEALRMADVAA